MLAQVGLSVIMTACIIGKWLQLKRMRHLSRAKGHEIMANGDVLSYYVSRNIGKVTPVEVIYRMTCERLVKMFSREERNQIAARTPGLALSISSREMELVKNQCEYAFGEEEIGIEYGMGMIATVVAITPMLGLLGTVWGVLDAFAEMGAQGNATISTLAPSISAALVTTVVGLLIAIPGVAAYNWLSAQIKDIISDIEKFTNDLLGRIALEMQRRDA